MKKAFVTRIGDSDQVTVVDEDGHTGIPLAYFKAAGDMFEALKEAVSKEVIRLEKAGLDTERSPWIRKARIALARARK